MYELTNAKFISKLPAGYGSCKGVGKSGPDPVKAKYLDKEKKVLVPLGNLVPSDIGDTELL